MKKRIKIRPIQIVGDIAYVPLNNGNKAIVDAVDVPLIQDYNWCVANCNNNLYVVSRTKNKKMVHMNRIIASTKNTISIRDFVKHINGNNLDNRRSNFSILKRKNRKNTDSPKTKRLNTKLINFKPQYCIE